MTKRKFVFGIVMGALLAVIAAIIIFGRTDKTELEVPNILGAWYSTSGTDEVLTFYDDKSCTSSLSPRMFHYDFVDAAHIEIRAENKTITLKVVTESSDGSATSLISPEETYIRNQGEASRKAENNGASDYATYNAEVAFSKILQADQWTLKNGACNETLTFEPDRVKLTWDAGTAASSSEQEWAWAYLGVHAEPDESKPISVKMQLTSLDSNEQRTGMLYLYTDDAEQGFYFTSELFPAMGDWDSQMEERIWQQSTSQASLEAADDSNQEGENVVIAGAGGAGAPMTYSDSYAAENDPFSSSYIEPKPGDIDPETGKKIKTYIRAVSGDICTITITYDDGTTSTQTIEKEVNVAREKVDIDYTN